MGDLFKDLPSSKKTESVQCLGITFDNDEARRVHFTEELCRKLHDPEFRKIEGFPIGSDEDILTLSDPPYYTACPNPWIADSKRNRDSIKMELKRSPEIFRDFFSIPFLWSRGYAWSRQSRGLDRQCNTADHLESGCPRRCRWESLRSCGTPGRAVSCTALR